MGALNERGNINAASIGIYFILTLLLGVVFWRNGIRQSIGFLFVLLFTVVKTIGGAMTVYVQTTLDMRLYTPAAIIGTVVLSPLMLGICNFLTPEKIIVKNFRDQRAKIAPKIFIVTRTVIFSALAFGVVGGLHIFTTHTTPKGIQLGQILIRTAAGLCISSWTLICCGLYLLYPERHAVGIAYFIVAYMVMPVFLVRLAYGCGVASTFQTNLTQIFNPLGGNWILFLVMDFLPEVFITGSLVGLGLVQSIHEK
ncbi:hypothetical protein K3495_g5773 [Podosphaera aphanis]|nr:hypothetical protein K3495_g5773 [Podosphaera aphanis]